jgi:choline dehydrogenase-like flavoprotein
MVLALTECHCSREPPRTRLYSFAPLELTGPSQRIFKAARSLGLNPSFTPMALRFRNAPRCLQCLTCDGFPCKVQAKSDACTFLEMNDEGRMQVFTGISVDRLEFSQEDVYNIKATDVKSGEKLNIPIEGKPLVLAAGALWSPEVLLRSQLETLKDVGRKDLIGRRLMRHCNAVLAGVFPFHTNVRKEFQKQLAIFDFYDHHRQKHGYSSGVIQDIYTPSSCVISANAPFPLKTISGMLSSRIQSLLCIAEDEAQENNRIELNANNNFQKLTKLKIFHQYTKRDLERRDFLLQQAKKILKRSGALLFYTMHINSFSHAVGTLVMGSSPAESVLDPNCKFWGVKNLWVLDGSFMPRSAGVNPSLTIVANSLRVIDTQFKEKI